MQHVDVCNYILYQFKDKVLLNIRDIPRDSNDVDVFDKEYDIGHVQPHTTLRGNR